MVRDEPSAEAEAPGRAGLDIESWLRSPGKRALLVSVIVLLAAAGTTLQFGELIGLRGGEVPWRSLFVNQLVYWTTWALLAFPALALARLMLRFKHSWILFLIVQAPLSVGVAEGVQWVQRAATQQMFGRDSFFERGPSRGDRDRDERGGGRSERAEPDPQGPQDPQSTERGGERGFDRSRPNPFRRGGSWGLTSLRLTREILIYWLILCAGAAMNAFLLARSEERSRNLLLLRTEKLSAQLAQAQVDSLRRQLHPHFLFNALHSVGGLIRAGEDRKALSMLSSIGELLRTTLDRGDAPRLSLRDELQIVERYSEIERIRFGDRLEVEIDAAPDTLKASVPAFLLLPLVENSVKHGISKLTEGGHVRVSAERRGERLVLEVADDGPGFPVAMLGNDGKLAKGSENSEPGRVRVGLANDRDRLHALYGDGQSLVIENPPAGGAVVRIELPFEVLGEEAGEGPAADQDD